MAEDIKAALILVIETSLYLIKETIF